MGVKTESRSTLLRKAQMAREMSIRHLPDFLELVTSHRWQRAPHLMLLCEKLEAVARGEIRRLMVFMPPRHGKSECISRGFPAWYLGNHPDNEIILTSYGAELAIDMSRWAQAYFAQVAGTLWGLSGDPRQQAAERWGPLQHRGRMVAAGVGGPISGRGGNVVIMDDPVKNLEEARSPRIQEMLYEWYGSVVRTRLAPGGSVILVMTRWDSQDLAGQLLEDAKHGKDEWEVLNFPALATGPDELGRNLGEALWPWRYSLEELEDLQRSLPPFIWAALYQQDPQLDAATHIFHQATIDKTRVLEAPQLELRVVAVDVATTSKRRSNATGIIGAARGTDQHGYVLADRSGVMPPAAWGAEAVTVFHEIGAHFIVVESNQGGEMIAENIWQIDPSIPVVEMPSLYSKFGSAIPIATMYNQGTIHHVGFLPELEVQMCRLTPRDLGQLDDRMDANRIALTFLMLAEPEQPTQTVVTYEDRHEISPF